MLSLRLTGTLLVSICAVGCTVPSDRSVTECIAPAAPGGGWDLTCRSVGRVLSEMGLVNGTVQVTNIPGAGGGIALAHTVTQRGRDANLLVAASPSITLGLSQKRFGTLTERSVRWVAAIGSEAGVLVVRSDAPWETLTDLMGHWQDDPGAITVSGGSAVASQDHMKVLLVAREAGIPPRAVRYIPFDGGGEALTAMLGGFVDLFSGEVSEITGHLEAGTVRVIAVLSPERLGGDLGHIPTARESGYDVEWVTWRGFYAPAETADTTYERWVDTLTRLESSQEWAAVRTTNRLEPFFVAGEDFTRFINRQVVEFQSISREIGLIP